MLSLPSPSNSDRNEFTTVPFFTDSPASYRASSDYRAGETTEPVPPQARSRCAIFPAPKPSSIRSAAKREYCTLVSGSIYSFDLNPLNLRDGTVFYVCFYTLNGNGKVTISDVTQLQRYPAQMVDTLGLFLCVRRFSSSQPRYFASGEAFAGIFYVLFAAAVEFVSKVNYNYSQWSAPERRVDIFFCGNPAYAKTVSRSLLCQSLRKLSILYLRCSTKTAACLFSARFRRSNHGRRCFSTVIRRTVSGSCLQGCSARRCLGLRTKSAVWRCAVISQCGIQFIPVP